jgi:tRNA-(ms[2]io[6]A)-hydroxylase
MKRAAMTTSDPAAFLGCPTPKEWITVAVNEIPTLLIDHANCEKKAASNAMSMMYRYVDKPELLEKLSQLAREELLHFEQVVGFMRDRHIPYRHLGPARYAGGLRGHIRTHEPARLVDILIIGAFVEARSCERFGAVAPHLEADLQKFYLSLLRSEARHFADYLALARLYAQEDIAPRIAFFADLEVQLISSPDALFRFHSGVPAGNYLTQ